VKDKKKALATLTYLYAHECEGYVPRSLRPDRRLAGIDVEAEYKLIQRKESKLSANMRRLVVREVERGR